MAEKTGRCLCGAVTYTARDLELHVHACHCGMCRRWSGGPGFALQAGAVEFQGESHIRRYRSSEWAERGFCGECGTNLFYRLVEPGTHMLQMGTLDDQSDVDLAGEIYIDAKPPGYALAGEHPRLTEAEFMESIGLK